MADQAHQATAVIGWAADPPAAGVPWQMWVPTLIGVVVTAAAGVIGTVWVRRMGRRLDDATADKTLSEARRTAAETVSVEVATARDLIATIKSMMADQRSEFMARDAERTEQIKGLVEQTAENREQLRAIRSAFASHEMWDRDAVAALRQHLPGFPDPPPVDLE